MHRIERKKMYLEELKKHNFIISTKFIEIFESKGINSATIRRDLKELEKEGYITLTFGGINVNIGNGDRSNSLNKEVENLEAKLKIASAANSLLEDGDIIFCAGGTTIETFVENINKPIRLIVTNSLAVLKKVIENKNIKDVALIGGLYRHKYQVFIPGNSSQLFRDIKVHKSFYSAIAFDNLGNAYDDFFPEYEVIRVAIQNSESNYLLIDSSKIHSFGNNPVVNASQITKIISDENIPEWLADKIPNLIIVK